MIHHHTQCVHCGTSYEVVSDHKYISEFCCADASHYDDDYDEDVAEYFVDYDEQDYYEHQNQLNMYPNRTRDTVASLSNEAIETIHTSNRPFISTSTIEVHMTKRQVRVLLLAIVLHKEQMDDDILLSSDDNFIQERIEDKQVLQDLQEAMLYLREHKQVPREIEMSTLIMRTCYALLGLLIVAVICSKIF